MKELNEAVQYVPIIQPDTAVHDKEFAAIVIDEKQVITEKFKGYGVQWDPYIARPIHIVEWKQIVKRVNFLKPSFIRCMIYAPIYANGIDGTGKVSYRFESEEAKELYRLLDYCESREIEVILGEWETPGKFGGGFAGITVDDPRWAKIISGFLEYLVHEKNYTCIHYFNYVNEANTEWSLCQDYEKWKKGIDCLQKELVRYGLHDQINITGPDSVWDEDEKWLRHLAEDEDTDAKIGLYDVHMYPTIEEIMNGEMQKRITLQRSIVTGKDFYMTELGMVTGKTDGDSQPYTKEYCYGVIMADCAAQIMNGGFSGVAIWDMDDAMHSQENGFADTDIRSLKQWGFWNSVAGRMYQKPEEESLRPHFYTWSLLTHLFPRGCTIVTCDQQSMVQTGEKTTSSLPGLRISAMKMINEKGKTEITILVVNDSYVPRSVKIQWDECCISRVKLNQYNYFEDDIKTDKDGFPVKKMVWENVDLQKGICLDLYGPGVIFLSTLEG